MSYFQKTWKKAYLWLFTGWILLGLVGCKTVEVLPPSAVVEGRVSGENGNHQPVADVLINLQHDENRTGRNVYRSKIPTSNVQSIRLAMTAGTGLPFAEEWHLIHLSSESPRPGSDVRSPTEFTDDRGWIRNHTGELLWLSIRRDELALPGNFYRPPTASLRSGGALILSRIEDDDPILPWTSSDCSPRAVMPMSVTLRPPRTEGVGDCFDMQSLSSLILNQLALTITEVALPHPIRAVSHSLKIVPHIASPVNGDEREIRPGIGFVYSTTLEPLVGSTSTGPITGTLTLSVPITWVFAGFSDSFRTQLDPITNAALGNTRRITVFADPDSIALRFADQLRREVVDGISNMPTPAGTAGIPLNSYIDFLLQETVLGGDPRLPADFGVIALPTGRAGYVPTTDALRMGEILVADLELSKGLADGRGARTVRTRDGKAEVLVNLNRSGTRVRQFSLPNPIEPVPFKLVIQR